MKSLRKRIARISSGILIPLHFFLTSCAGTPPTENPIPSITSVVPDSSGKTLVVMLPGRGDRAENFVKADFVEIGNRQHFDVIAVDAHFGYYNERNLIPRLHDDIIVPAKKRGYENIWMLGVSMGGFGSLLYAAEHPEMVSGVILLAPFLGGLVPHIDSREIDRRLDLKGMDLCSRYATLAARRALDEAGIKPRPKIMEQVGLILGIATGPGQGENDHLRAIFESNFELRRLGAFPYVVPNEVAGHVARSLMLKGHSTVLAAGPGAGLTATISAITALEQGHVDTVLAAASDELTERSVSDGHKVGFWGPSTAATPGEGAAVLVLERRNTAEKRGGKILAQVLGCARITDCSGPRSGDVDALRGKGDAESLSEITAEGLVRVGLVPEAVVDMGRLERALGCGTLGQLE